MADNMNEIARLRLVRQYYRSTPESHVHGLHSSGDFSQSRTSLASAKEVAPDTTLAAFLQLITIRLSMQRAIVSLVDRDHQVCCSCCHLSTRRTYVLTMSLQYFIAEATRTGHIVDPTIYEKEGDHQWMGCTGFAMQNTTNLSLTNTL